MLNTSNRIFNETSSMTFHRAPAVEVFEPLTPDVPLYAHSACIDEFRHSARGHVQIDRPTLADAHWVKLNTNYVPDALEGQEVDVYRTKELPHWFHLAARPRSSQMGRRYEGFNVYVDEGALAEHLVTKLREGHFRLTPQVAWVDLSEGIAALGLPD